MRLLKWFIPCLAIIGWFGFYSCSGKKRYPEEQEKKIDHLGRLLFFDTRLSFNQTKSCGSCHDPKFAFSDNYRKSITATGDMVKHNAPSLINAGLLYYFDWANPTINSLHQQSDRPLYNTNPIELGVKDHEVLILSRLQQDPEYPKLFTRLFPDDKTPLRFSNIQTALAAYVNSLRSENAPYDKYRQGDSSALTASAKRGMQLFVSARLKCNSCHPPPYFTTASLTKNTDSVYFNTGLYNINGKNKYPAEDRGLEETTRLAADNGRFKAPSLRNLSLTSPYTHDGSVNTLDEMISIYAAGGRTITKGSYEGDGRQNLNKSHLIQGFSLSATERKDLIDFLFALTDSSILVNPGFRNPFAQTGK